MTEDLIDLTDVESRMNFLEQYIIGRDDVYAIQTTDGRYLKSTDAINRRKLAMHLDAFHTIGVYQLNDGMVHWVCYDVDNHGGDNEDSELERIMVRNCLDRKDVPYVTEASGSPQSYHIWIFLDNPVPVEKAYYWAQSMLCVGNERVVDCEVFPKQKSPKEYGNLVKMPLGRNRKTGVFSHFVGRDGTRLKKLFVETIDISDYEVPEATQPSGALLDECITSAGNLVVRSYDGVRPCFKKLLKMGYSMTGTEGHFLRIALAAEAWRCTDMNMDEMVSMFKCQGDFDYEKTEYQIRSVQHYNRISCETMIRRAPVAMTDLCKGCELKNDN